MNCEICQQTLKFGKTPADCEKKGFFELGGLWYSRRMVQGAWRVLRVCSCCKRATPTLGLQKFCKLCKQKMGDD